MMETARTSETSVDNYFTRKYIPEENSELHSHGRENLKSHILGTLSIFFSLKHGDSETGICLRYEVKTSLRNVVWTKTIGIAQEVY
jgi:hypothetical protein